jgi:inorganic phosphate transporter, PiT family
MIPASFLGSCGAMLTATLCAALLYAFLNGYKDSPSIVATAVFSGALNPRPGLLLSAAAQVAAPFLLGTAVARTFTNGILDSRAIPPQVVLAALCAAILWNLVTWMTGIPSSSTHGLVGGLVGAGVAAAGWGVLRAAGLTAVLISLVLSPVLGLAFGFVAIRSLVFLLRRATPRANALMRRLQLPAVVALAMSHGVNDPPKTMGVIVLALLASGKLLGFEIPLWVVLASLAAFAAGTSLAGWRVMRTLGGRIVRVRPVHSLAALTAGSIVVMGAGLVGAPVSLPQVMSTSVLGVGAGDRLNQVRWHILRDMLAAWLLTLPVSALLAAIAYFALRQWI